MYYQLNVLGLSGLNSKKQSNISFEAGRNLAKFFGKETISQYFKEN